MNRDFLLHARTAFPDQRALRRPVLLRRARASSALLALALAASVAGCSSDPCEDAVQALCEEACACTGEAACGVTFGEDGGGLSLGFDDAADCAALFRAGCADDAEDPIDGEACAAAVDGATCGETGLIVPAACGGTE